MHRWGYFDDTKPRPTPKVPGAPTDAEIETLESWDHEDVIARYLLSQRLPDITFVRLSQYQTAQARWAQVNDEYTAKSVYVLNKLEEAFYELYCPEDVDVRTYVMSVRYKRDELAAAGVQIGDTDYQRAVMHGIPQELMVLASRFLSAARLTHHAIDTDTLIDYICKEAERLENRFMRSPQDHGGSNKRKEVTDETIAATGSGGRRRRRRGKCHDCGKEGHRARDCRAPKGEATETAQAAQPSSGVTKQPETNPTGVAKFFPVFIVNEDGSWTPGEDHVQIASTEPDGPAW